MRERSAALSDRSFVLRRLRGFPVAAAESPVAPRAMTGSRHCAANAWLWSAVGAFTLLGLSLRIAAARGDLWLDEIWSLELVGRLRSAGAVFWGISHDNNHYLNSLWLYLMGPGQPPLIYRLPAVVLGTASIPAAAWIGLRRNPATAILAAGLAAVAFPLVNYGSEARGYAGEILATLVAFACFERALEPLTSAAAPVRTETGTHGRSARWLLGAAIGLGALSHLTMVVVLGALALTGFARLLIAGRSIASAVDETVELFSPSLVMLIPAVAAVLAGILVQGGLEFGGTSPFAIASFRAGYGELIRLTLGLPASVPSSVLFVVVGVGVAAAFAGRIVLAQRIPLVLAGIVVVPSMMVAARLPNLEFPRYFLMSGIVLLIFEAEAIGGLWERGTALSRGLSAGLFALTFAGQAIADASLLRDGRGGYGAALDAMAGEPHPAYASDHRFRTKTVVDYLAGRRGLRFDYVGPDTFCRDRPNWFVDVGDEMPDPPAQVDIGPPDCRTSFIWRASFPASALSGMRWTLYHRAS